MCGQNDRHVALTKYRGITVAEDAGIAPGHVVLVCMPVTGLISCIVVGPNCKQTLMSSLDLGKMPDGWTVINAIRDVSYSLSHVV